MSDDLKRLRALVEMSAELSERLHRTQEAGAFRRVLDMIDGLTPKAATVCPICGNGEIEAGRCNVCGIKYSGEGEA